MTRGGGHEVDQINQKITITLKQTNSKIYSNKHFQASGSLLGTSKFARSSSSLTGT